MGPISSCVLLGITIHMYMQETAASGGLRLQPQAH